MHLSGTAMTAKTIVRKIEEKDSQWSFADTKVAGLKTALLPAADFVKDLSWHDVLRLHMGAHILMLVAQCFCFVNM